jgi:TPR repeat protein
MIDALALAAALIVGSGTPADISAPRPDPAWLDYQRGEHARALREYRTAAERGERLAQFNLAMMLFRGEGQAADPEQALEWLRKAAAAGLPQAQHNLGLLYEHGARVPRSQVDAAVWYRRAAEQGHPVALLALATQFFLGLCVHLYLVSAA